MKDPVLSLMLSLFLMAFVGGMLLALVLVQFFPRTGLRAAYAIEAATFVIAQVHFVRWRRARRGPQ